MNSKNHRQNHNFQIAYFLCGACHTADGAYSLLCDLREERQLACDNYKVNQLKDEAKEIRAKRLLESKDKSDKLDGKAELLELKNNRKIGKVLYQAALDEINFIDKCINAIQPLRKFKHLSDPEAHEAAQYDEWRLELISRMENSMMTTGTITTEQFAIMRLHPAFQKEILPRINEIQELMKTKEGIKKLQEEIKGSKFQSINKLIENKFSKTPDFNRGECQRNN